VRPVRARVTTGPFTAYCASVAQELLDRVRMERRVVESSCVVGVVSEGTGSHAAQMRSTGGRRTVSPPAPDQEDDER